MQVNKIRYLSNYSQLEIDALKHIGYQVTPFHRIITKKHSNKGTAVKSLNSWDEIMNF